MNTSNQSAVQYKFEPSKEESFKVLLDEGPYFFTPFHFHRECQLTLVLEGNGTRFIGENVERFSAGDVVLIGSNLPHVFRNDPHYYRENAGLTAKAISIFFLPEFMDKTFWDRPETKPLADWITQSRRGIVFEGETRRQAARELRRINEMEAGFPRLMAFLNLLYRLFRSSESRFLSAPDSPPAFRPGDSHKLHRIFEYVMENFHLEIRLNSVAELASMTPAAFSRYFKRQTRKTFTEFVLEIRIAEASKLLIEEASPIGEIAYRCGFNNISNFNRRFRKIKGRTPREYRREFVV